MIATATNEVRRLLSADPAAVDRAHEQLAGARNARDKAPHCRMISLKEFDLVGSPHLRLERFVHLGGDSKKYEIEAVGACAERWFGKCPERPVPAFRFSALPGARSMSMKLQSRLIVNQAGGVLENAGLCLHRHWGSPMIPGSAAKGIARHAAMLEIRAADAEAKARLLVHAALVFGWCSEAWSDRPGVRPDSFAADFRWACDGRDWKEVWTEAASQLLSILRVPQEGIDSMRPWESLPDMGGRVSFLPALPVAGSVPRIVADLVNCHHPDYYSGATTQAADNQNPIPNFFPAVAEGLVFEFTVVPLRNRPSAEPVGLTPDALAEHALHWLGTGLADNGAGAKTAAGYGWFEEDAEALRLAEQERERQAEEERRKAELAAMSPEERAAEELWAQLPAADPIAEFKGMLARIESLSETEQRSLLRLCAGRAKVAWLADRQEHDRLKNNPRKQARSKSFARVARVLALAGKLGVELP